MGRSLGIISIIIVFVSLPCCILYKMGATSYLDKFFDEQMIPLMGTILALNFTLISSLQVFLLSIEEQKNIVFSTTRKELKSNIVAMIAIFVLSFFLQITDFKFCRLVFYILMGTKLTLFFTYMYIVYDLSSALFKITNKKS